jgi:hypothetical protein
MMPALDGSGASLLQGAYAQVELGANGAPIGAVSVEADGVDPWPGDDAGSPLRDLVVHGAGLGTPGRCDPNPRVLRRRGPGHNYAASAESPALHPW